MIFEQIENALFDAGRALTVFVLALFLATFLVACDAMNAARASDVDTLRATVTEQGDEIDALRERLAILEEATANASAQIGTSIEGLRDLGAFVLTEYESLEPGEVLTTDTLSDDELRMLRDFLGR